MSEGALILLAEDHPVNRKVALLLLNRLGFNSEAVEDGGQAVEAAKTGKFSLILMDIMMPDVDGLEATRRIRQWEYETGARRMPIIALTAMAMVGDKEQCMEAGMDDYIAKPIEPPVLKSKVSKWLKKAEALESPAEDSNSQIDISQLQEAYGEEDVNGLLDLFLHVTTEMLSELRLGVRDIDYASIERLSHELKGSSAAIYAYQFSSLCAELEEAAKNHSNEKISQLFPMVAQCFADIEVSLNRPG